MFRLERVATGGRIAVGSASLLRDNLRLLCLPLAGSFLTAAYAVVVVGLLMNVGPASTGMGGGSAGWKTLAALYFGMTVLPVSFICATTHAARDAMSGRTPSLRRSLAAVWARKRTIIVWSVANVAVQLLARAMQGSDSRLAQYGGLAVRGSWSVASYFVFPVLVFEDENALGVMRRSAGIVRDTWGEAAGLGFSLGVVYAAVFGVAGVAALVVGAVTHIVFALIAAVPLGVAAFSLAAAFTAIARAALYEYATTGAEPRYFAHVDLDAA